MGNIDFRKIQISGPPMNFVLEPQNFSGKNSNSPINTAPASLCTAVTYNVNSFALYAPSGATLSGSSATEIQFQGSNDGVNWTVPYSITTTVGSVGEVITSISSNLTTGNFQQHRLAIQSQGQPIAVAQAQFNVAVTGINEE
jgi:hypothetical protein